jgi:hypothetical protein
MLIDRLQNAALAVASLLPRLKKLKAERTRLYRRGIENHDLDDRIAKIERKVEQRKHLAGAVTASPNAA